MPVISTLIIIKLGQEINGSVRLFKLHMAFVLANIRKLSAFFFPFRPKIENNKGKYLQCGHGCMFKGFKMLVVHLGPAT